MITRRNVLISASAFAVLSSAGSAFAINPFTDTDFKAAQDAGKPIFVDVWASWCPTCKAQQPTLSKLETDPKYKDVVTLRINFDTQQEAMQSLGVDSQSTLIAFKGKKEVARSVGVTDPTEIEAMFAAALANS